MCKNRTKSAEKTIFGKNGKKMASLMNLKNYDEVLSLMIYNSQVQAFKGEKGKTLSQALKNILNQEAEKKKMIKITQKFQNSKDLKKK